MKKMHSELSPLMAWIALRIVSTYSKFQVNIFCNKGDITKYQFLHNNANTKATAIPWVFLENSRTTNVDFSKLKAY